MSVHQHLSVTQPGRFAIDELPDGNGTTRVVVRGELDLANSPQLPLALERALAAADTVVLDLSRVEFIDSTGLRAILAGLRSPAAADDRLLISSSLPPQVQRLFELVGVLDRLPLADR